MLEDYKSEKDRIIVEQRRKITTLSDESEKLRRERDELLAYIRELGSCPGSNLAVLSSTLACDCPGVNMTSYYPPPHTNFSRSSTKRPVSQQARSRTKSANLVNQSYGLKNGPSNSISDGW